MVGDIMTTQRPVPEILVGSTQAHYHSVLASPILPHVAAN